MQSNDTWYFAYGSNLEPEWKELRTGAIRRADVCRLPGYRLAFNKRAPAGHCYANIVSDEKAEVWGVAYLCSLEALERMDEYEGAAGGHYRRVRVRIFTKSREARDAVVYVAGASFVCGPRPPSPEYLGRILKGARHHGLPAEYISFIEMFAHEA